SSIPGRGRNLGQVSLLHTVSEKYSSASTLVCKTAAFYPGNLTFNWYVNGTIISTGINITQQQNSDGLSMEVAQPILRGAVYTCKVGFSLHEIAGHCSFNL
uniref:Ig-like domain-containing protein n=1 Tax=Callorhinchus milii TaxID=7868 RepID=A0A4W3H1P0_CALMI